MWAVITPYAREYEMPTLYWLAAATNAARVADRQHWVSDTVGGALLGYAAGSLLWNAQRKTERGGPMLSISADRIALVWETY